MLWSGKLFIVGVTVDAYAMVGIDADLEYQRSDIDIQEKDVVPQLLMKHWALLKILSG